MNRKNISKRKISGKRRNKMPPIMGGSGEKEETKKYLERIEAYKKSKEKEVQEKKEIPDYMNKVFANVKEKELELAEKIFKGVKNRIYDLKNSGETMKRGQATALETLLAHETKKIKEKNLPFPFDSVIVDERGKVFLRIRKDFPEKLRQELKEKYKRRYGLGAFFEL